jgi:hypothetical protein
MRDEKIAVEVKFVGNRATAAKDIAEEISNDVHWYQTHPRCRHLICLVHDPESRIANPVGFESDLDSLSTENLSVRVIVA